MGHPVYDETPRIVRYVPYVFKATIILLTAVVTVLANAAFLVVLNTAYYRVVTFWAFI